MMTAESKHTPGPWRNGSVHIVADVESIGKKTEVIVCHVWNRGSDAQTAANARLIAAAPELLAALQAILHPDNESIVYFVPSDSWAMKLRDDALAAVAKATGGAP